MECFRNSREASEVLFSVAGALPAALRSLPANCRVLEGPVGALTPHLWRNGIRAARSERVALTSANFSPPDTWVAAAGCVDLDRWVGVGGHIGAAIEGGLRWAVYLLRYRAFAPPGELRDAAEIPADNAVYRRSAIVQHPDLLELGFWEPSFHARFHAAGLRIGMDPALRADYVGQERGDTFCKRRFQHGRAFGLARAVHLKRSVAAVYLLASPLVPWLLLGRIGAWSLQRVGYRLPFISAFPWLTIFCLAWALGEGLGYLEALVRRPPSDTARRGRPTAIISENRDATP